jgi:mRNA interferase RelE/StbE
LTTKLYSVQLIAEARVDFQNLDKGRKLLVAKMLKQLESNPYKGEHLGNKAGINLTGYYKLYVDKKKIRIVYTVVEKEIVVRVIAIGPRQGMVVYREAIVRLGKRK